MDKPSKMIVARYALEIGYLEVWRSWRDTMLSQGREVPPIRMWADSLPQNDIELDKQIAFDVVMDFLVWYSDPSHWQTAIEGAKDTRKCSQCYWADVPMAEECQSCPHKPFIKGAKP